MYLLIKFHYRAFPRQHFFFVTVISVNKNYMQSAFPLRMKLNWGELPSVLCCARILVLTFGFEGKINLWGAVGVSLFRVWLTWEETPCQVRDCCKYLSVEECHKESLCLQRDSFWYLSRCAVPS